MDLTIYQTFAQEKLGVTFNNIDLLITAFTHRSYLNEHKKTVSEHNERLEFLQEDGTSLPLDAQFLFSRECPYAVEATFGAEQTRWTFARDLLLNGIFESAGEGDICVWPTLSEDGKAAVILQLTSQNPGRDAYLQIPTKVIANFIQETDLFAAIGQEAVDIDTELERAFPTQQ